MYIMETLRATDSHVGQGGAFVSPPPHQHHHGKLQVIAYKK